MIKPIFNSRSTIRQFDMTEADYRNLDDDYCGLCLACGEEAYGIEPDARRYTCEVCDEEQVYGAAELLMMDKIQFVDQD